MALEGGVFLSALCNYWEHCAAPHRSDFLNFISFFSCLRVLKFHQPIISKRCPLISGP